MQRGQVGSGFQLARDKGGSHRPEQGGNSQIKQIIEAWRLGPQMGVTIAPETEDPERK